ncbi:/ / hypothetical protein / 417568:417750 Forward [Candidatus Hepatoplasma crinochetorum]|uniref:Uncharacterized protein n=1 Tax=Candidatus Hepatoplasma crinochetorum TaxID=295596 RepID=A0A0G7ZL90_9MOLU|nr:/ / hypothetical protein / 417568:417750 Forward [Candidatus Hepatoplasma crinochetorum]
MAQVAVAQGRNRDALAREILNVINQVGQDKIISIILDETGRLANRGGLLSLSKAYIFYKN